MNDERPPEATDEATRGDGGTCLDASPRWARSTPASSAAAPPAPCWRRSLRRRAGASWSSRPATGSNRRGPTAGRSRDARQVRLGRPPLGRRATKRWCSGHRRDGRGVGGGTMHYGGVALRLWPEDFERDSPATALARLADLLRGARALLRPRRARDAALRSAARAVGAASREVPAATACDDGARLSSSLTGMHSLGMRWSEYAARDPRRRARGPLAVHELRLLPVGLQEPRQDLDAASTTSRRPSSPARRSATVARVTLIETDASRPHLAASSTSRDGDRASAGGRRRTSSRRSASRTRGCCCTRRAARFPTASPTRRAWSAGLPVAHIADGSSRASTTRSTCGRRRRARCSRSMHYGTQPGRDFCGGWSWMTSSSSRPSSAARS